MAFQSSGQNGANRTLRVAPTHHATHQLTNSPTHHIDAIASAQSARSPLNRPLFRPFLSQALVVVRANGLSIEWAKRNVTLEQNECQILLF